MENKGACVSVDYHSLKREQVRTRAEEYYRNGEFYCSEAVVKSVVEQFEGEVPPYVVAMASGFPVGIGGAECTCGAISGGVMAIGYFSGREEAGSDKVVRCMASSRELYDRFIERNRRSCCKVLTRGMVKGQPDHMRQCIRFTGEVAADCYDIVAKLREESK